MHFSLDDMILLPEIFIFQLAYIIETFRNLKVKILRDFLKIVSVIFSVSSF